MGKRKSKLPHFSIDGKSILKSFTGIFDAIRYRKYAKEGFVTVLHINKQNNVIRILHGKLEDDSIIGIPEIKQDVLINKVYMLPTKKLVTKCVIIKEGCNTTLDVTHTDISSLTPALLEKYTNIKIMEEFNSFNMGQVLLGAMIGIMIGAVGAFGLIITYNAFLI